MLEEEEPGDLEGDESEESEGPWHDKGGGGEHVD